MRILLINPPCGPRTLGLNRLACIEPLGLELVGAGVSRQHEVRLVDMMVRPDDLHQTLRTFRPDVAGVTSEIVRVQTALDALRTVRRHVPGCLTVVGGHQATLCPEDFADPVVDLVVLGEGVETFAEICAVRAAGGQRYDHIPGLRLRTRDGWLTTPPRPLPLTLDHQPAPDRSLTARYRRHYFYLFEPAVAAVRTSVGCSFPCTFCSCRVYSHRQFIPRSPQQVFAEIRDLEEDFVMFCDDHSFHNPEQMRVLGELLLAAEVRKRYFAYSRVDCVVENRELFALWARVGLTLVMTGLEALDEETLRRTGKRTEQEQNEKAIRILEELGIGVSAGFLVHPEFREADFDAIDRYLESRPAILLAEFTPLTPLPGTPLHRSVRERLLTEDRQLYDLQHFLLPTTLPPSRLYRRMLQSYSQVILRLIRKLRLWRPQVLLSRHLLRVGLGLVRNTWAYSRAHRDVPWRRNGPSPSSGRKT